MNGNQRRVIIMQPGPIHLFWTTGVFYLWSLKDRFDFVLIVPENYRDHPQFIKVAGLPAFRHVEYLSQRGRLWRHFSYSSTMKALLEKHPPAYLLLHNRSYIENQYLIHWARKLFPEAKRYYYQNGRMSLMWQDDFKARRAVQIDSLAHRLPILGHYPRFAGRIVDIRNYISYLLNFKLLPLLAIHSAFSPPVNVTNGLINREATLRMSNRCKDYLLAYLANEIEAYRAQGIENIVQMQHPLASCKREVFEFLYGEVIETDSILLLPSYGFTSRLLESGWKKDSLVKHLGSKWCEAIEKLLEHFPGYLLKIKLHPASFADPVWKEIIDHIRRHFPAIEIIDPKQSAEWHVVQSKVIVGDVTTVLWWAGMAGGKVVVSLDVFGYPGGDELKEYPEIILYLTEKSAWPELLKTPITGQGPLIQKAFS